MSQAKPEMPQAAPETAAKIFPFLRYQDARAAITWLTEVLGFAEQEVYDGPDGTIAHAQLSLGAGIIMLSSSTDDNPLGLISPAAVAGHSQGIYLYVPEVDSCYQRVEKHGADIVIELQDMEYGSREFAVRDPEGYLWSVGTYLPGG